MKVFIDTSVLIRHYYGVDKSIRLLNFALNENDAVISPNVIEETFFKLLYIETERLFGKTGKYAVKDRFLKHREKFRSVEKYIVGFIIENVESGIIELLNVNSEILRKSVEIGFNYGLLPNDALIAAACKHYGIKKIATFDDDFRKVDFLEIITLHE
ncbi:putative nucleic acid-binding protein, contains PIN domain [Geoglobus ahangari]|uniref:Ribonuclease VapC n=1 Tax=Geoglobus ahangari TaxID=113653 RepID=A0A0F7IGH5_9EURY|nr:type II toxin-antitoxin system VapC family toxin [Geoglobus ahangari]AKG92353.1 putative nucleic acid-binding protein, contains PIN domain [Geoglobus ahangari]